MAKTEKRHGNEVIVKISLDL